MTDTLVSVSQLPARPTEAVALATLLTPGIAELIEQLTLDALASNQVGCPVVHRFAPGIYIREVCIPADTFAVGDFQKFEHLNVMLKGKVTILNDSGGLTTLTAPLCFVSKPGRKVGYIHEDMVWQNIYATDETDIEALENMLIRRSPLHAAITEQLRHCATEEELAARRDFDGTLVAPQDTPAVPFPFGGYKVMVADSRIHGKGLFATADIAVGEVIAPWETPDGYTPAARYTNHSPAPNAKLEGNMLVALREVRGCAGGFVGEELTIDYRTVADSRRTLCLS